MFSLKFVSKFKTPPNQDFFKECSALALALKNELSSTLDVFDKKLPSKKKEVLLAFIFDFSSCFVPLKLLS